MKLLIINIILSLNFVHDNFIVHAVQPSFYFPSFFEFEITPEHLYVFSFFSGVILTFLLNIIWLRLKNTPSENVLESSNNSEGDIEKLNNNIKILTNQLGEKEKEIDKLLSEKTFLKSQFEKMKNESEVVVEQETPQKEIFYYPLTNQDEGFFIENLFSKNQDNFFEIRIEGNLITYKPMVKLKNREFINNKHLFEGIIDYVGNGNIINQVEEGSLKKKDNIFIPIQKARIHLSI